MVENRANRMSGPQSSLRNSELTLTQRLCSPSAAVYQCLHERWFTVFELAAD